MSQTNDGGPAFPTMDAGEADRCPSLQSPGMSLRDWFAGRANSFDLDMPSEKPVGKTWEAVVAEARYRFADAMLKARDGT